MKHDGTSAFYVRHYSSGEQDRVNSFLSWAFPERIPRKIGICGAHGVGKSSLAKALSEDMSLPLINEVARTVHGMGFELNKSGDIRSQSLIWLGQLYEELCLKEFVADRTIVDSLAYTSLMIAEKPDKVDDYVLTVMANISAEIVSSAYTVLFYIPIEFGIEDDGVRDTDPGYQREVDEMILRYLDGFGLDYFPLTGSLEQRQTTALTFLDEQQMLFPRPGLTE